MSNYLLRIKRTFRSVKGNLLYINGLITQRGPNHHLFLLKNISRYQNDKNAEVLLKQGLEKYPDHPELNKHLAQLYSKRKKWSKSIQYWNAYFDNSKQPGSVSDYLQLAIAFEKTKDFHSMEAIILGGLEVYPGNRKLKAKHNHAAVFSRKWETAITRLEEYIDAFQSNRPYNALLKLSMIQEITGNHEKASQLFSQIIDEYQPELKDDELGYRKIRLFDNGETVIDFYKQLCETDAIALTFDPIDTTVKNPPFGFKALNKQHFDIIAVRKRKEETYQQDLSKEEFEKTVQNVVQGYQDKIAYGASLGAYQALYYTSALNCRVLSLSPRLSVHPKYGKEDVIAKETFRHTFEIPTNAKISPIILFDPKNKMDRKFMNQGLKQSFPNGRFVEFPYGGHKMTTHLRNMGLLKEYLISFVYSNQIPERNRRKKAECPLYLRNLAKSCLHRQKLKWAENLLNQSLKQIPNDKKANEFKKDLLKAKAEHDNAWSVPGEEVD